MKIIVRSTHNTFILITLKTLIRALNTGILRRWRWKPVSLVWELRTVKDTRSTMENIWSKACKAFWWGTLQAGTLTKFTSLTLLPVAIRTFWPTLSINQKGRRRAGLTVRWCWSIAGETVVVAFGTTSICFLELVWWTCIIHTIWGTIHTIDTFCTGCSIGTLRTFT